MPITKRDVEAVAGKAILWDSGRGSVSGFGVRCQAVSKAFVYKYNRGGRSRWYTIGRFGAPWSVEEARIEARRLSGIVAAGGDPGADKKPKPPLDNKPLILDNKPLIVRDLCDRYMEAANAGTVLTRFKRPKKATTLSDDGGRIARHIKPLLGDLPIGEIDRHLVYRMVADIAAGKTAVDQKTGLRGRAIVTGGQTTAARVADLLSGIMAWAVDMNLIDANPVHGVRRFRGQPRDRFLRDKELSQLGRVITAGRASDQFHPYALAIIELLCLTGCRLGEISALRWSEIDVQNTCLRLVDTKTGQSMRPAGTVVIERIGRIERLAGSSFVFPASRGAGAYQGTKRQVVRIFGAANIEDASSHTLRHTFGSVASDLGYSDATIAGLLGHAGRGVTSRYVHRPDEALRSAADAVSKRIAALMFAADENEPKEFGGEAEVVNSSADGRAG